MLSVQLLIALFIHFSELLSVPIKTLQIWQSWVWPNSSGIRRYHSLSLVNNTMISVTLLYWKLFGVKHWLGPVLRVSWHGIWGVFILAAGNVLKSSELFPLLVCVWTSFSLSVCETTFFKFFVDWLMTGNIYRNHRGIFIKKKWYISYAFVDILVYTPAYAYVICPHPSVAIVPDPTNHWYQFFACTTLLW